MLAIAGLSREMRATESPFSIPDAGRAARSDDDRPSTLYWLLVSFASSEVEDRAFAGRGDDLPDPSRWRARR